MPNFSLPFALQLDASNRGLGAEPVGEGAQVQHGSVWQSSGWLPFLLLPPATLIHPLLKPRPAAMAAPHERCQPGDIWSYSHLSSWWSNRGCTWLWLTLAAHVGGSRLGRTAPLPQLGGGGM